MDIPQFMPILSHGAHPAGPETGACIMELASFLAGEEWSDHPSCTNARLAAAARLTNDSLPSEDRQQLLHLLPRLMGTSAPANDQILYDAAAKYVEHLRTHPDERVALNAEDAAYCAAGGLRYGISSAVLAVCDSGGDPIAFLSALIDAYDAATGRTAPATVTEDDLRRCAELTGAKA